MKQVIILFITLWASTKISEQISRLRNEMLRNTLEIILRAMLVGFSIFLKMGIMIIVHSLILFLEILGIIIIRKSEKELKEAEAKAREAERAEDMKDGVVYVLGENEYRVIDWALCSVNYR